MPRGKGVMLRVFPPMLGNFWEGLISLRLILLKGFLLLFQLTKRLLIETHVLLWQLLLKFMTITGFYMLELVMLIVRFVASLSLPSLLTRWLIRLWSFLKEVSSNF